MAQRVLRVVRDICRRDATGSGRFVGRLGHFLGELAALRTLTYLGAWKADQQMDVRSEAANVKLFATELLLFSFRDQLGCFQYRIHLSFPHLAIILEIGNTLDGIIEAAG